MSGFGQYVSKKVYQYELQTALYMLEPWEKFLFNSIALCLLIFSIATVYHFTPSFSPLAEAI